MKKLILLVIIASIYSCTTNSSQNTQTKTFLIKATGEVEVEPNMASFQINLNSTNPNYKDAKKALTDETNRLTDKLLKFGIDKKDLQSSNIGIDKSYEWIHGKRVFMGYNAHTNVKVTLNDITKIDLVYSDLLEDRTIDINGLNYAHSNPDSLQNIAYKNALKRSNNISEQLLKELPETQKEIINLANVKIQGSKHPPMEYKAEYDLIGNSNNLSINAGVIKVTSTLFIEYMIK
mgnify:CR=1 FL=1